MSPDAVRFIPVTSTIDVAVVAHLAAGIWNDHAVPITAREVA